MNSILASAGASQWRFYGNCRGIVSLVNTRVEKHGKITQLRPQQAGTAWHNYMMIGKLHFKKHGLMGFDQLNYLN